MFSTGQIDEFFSFLYRGDLGRVVFWFWMVSGIISSALVAAIFVIALKIRELFAVKPEPVVESGVDDIQSPWDEVTRGIGSTNQADWLRALILADSIVDGVLRERGLPGETMGERLKSIDRARFPSLDGIWEAHKLRNRIAHEAGGQLDYREARRAVMLYAEALREFGYLKE